MAQRIRRFPRELIMAGVVPRMISFGLMVDATSFPEIPKNLVLGETLGHLCFGDDEEFFPDGVPVFGPVSIRQGDCTSRRWTADLPLGTGPYWSGPILLLHDWARPDPSWRLLNSLEAGSLLAVHPGLGSVRFLSHKASRGRGELYMVGKTMRVWCGRTPIGHHAAYTQAPAVNVDEFGKDVW